MVESEFGTNIMNPCNQNTLWGMFPWHTLGQLTPVHYRLNATDYFSIVVDHVHPFMATTYPSFNGYFLYDNVPCHKGKVVKNKLSGLMFLHSSFSEVEIRDLCRIIMDFEHRGAVMFY